MHPMHAFAHWLHLWWKAFESSLCHSWRQIIAFVNKAKQSVSSIITLQLSIATEVVNQAIES